MKRITNCLNVANVELKNLNSNFLTPHLIKLNIRRFAARPQEFVIRYSYS
jgi:hypothetical protein